MVALGERRWPDVAKQAPILLLPLGSCEQHGLHLPLDTDTRIAVAIATAVANVRPMVAVAPALAFGASGEHAAFAGTLSIGTDALATVVIELVRSADWATKVVLVNGHGGNLDGLRRAIVTLQGEGRNVVAWYPTAPGGDAHAGRTETSLLLAIAPELVQLELAVAGATEPIASLLGRLRAGGVKAVSENGVLGDPAGASAEEGHRLLAGLVASLGARVDAP